MRTVLTLPPAVYEQVLSQVTSVPGRIVEFPGGIRRSATDLEVFLQSAGAEADRRRQIPGMSARVRFGLWPRFMSRTTWHYWSAFPIPRSIPDPILEVGLLPDGGFCGAAIEAGGLGPLDELRLPGPGMRRWLAAEPPAAIEPVVPREGRFSRLAGALGGEHVLRRLQDSRFGIAGVGRTGSLLAHSLARMGVSHLVLVDPDLVEVHNLDAMDGMGEHDIGKPKAVALASFLSRHFPALDVLALPAEVESGPALEALAACDILITAPDSGHARLTAATLATLYLRPHLDVGTGIFRDPPVPTAFAATGLAAAVRPDRHAIRTGTAMHRPALLAAAAGRLDAGADVRLLLPGEGCLLCVGGIRRPARASRHADWREERAGSLRSVNQIAAHLGLHLLERLYSNDLPTSSWQQLRTAGSSPFDLTTIPTRPDPTCPLCSHAGHGDLALAHIAAAPGSR